MAPFALSHTTTGGERLYALDAEAARCGLQVGQSVSDAKALEPMLQLRPADPAGDIRRLAALARGCGRWSPWTAPDPGRPGEDGVLLEITGCAHLFGGEDALLAETLGALRRQGHSAHGAIAPTIGLAWGLARHVAPGRPTGQVITDDITTAMAPLPVAALRIGDTAATLRRFGLKPAVSDGRWSTVSTRRPAGPAKSSTRCNRSPRFAPAPAMSMPCSCSTG